MRTHSDHIDKKEKRKKKKRSHIFQSGWDLSATNLELPRASRKTTGASAPLCRSVIPPLGLLSAHRNLAGWESDLEDKENEKVNWLIAVRGGVIDLSVTVCLQAVIDISEVLVNLCKLGRSTGPPPGAKAWRTVWGGRCASLNAAVLYSRCLCAPKWWMAAKKKTQKQRMREWMTSRWITRTKKILRKIYK